MTRGEKSVSFKIEGKTYTYLQPGWWCSLSDPDDLEGQLVDEDNQIADSFIRQTSTSNIFHAKTDHRQVRESRGKREGREHR
jgi:hypothetical protein